MAYVPTIIDLHGGSNVQLRCGDGITEIAGGVSIQQRAGSMFGSGLNTGVISVWNYAGGGDFNVNLFNNAQAVSGPYAPQVYFLAGFGVAQFQAVSTLGTIFSAVGTFTTADCPVNYLLSFHIHTGSGSIVQLYVNDASVSIPVTPGSDASGTISAFNSLSVIAESDSNTGLFADLYLSDFWFGSTTGFVDLSVTANRRKFINADLTPVDLGSTGQNPFGASPQFFQTVGSGDPASAWQTNRGSLGGSFTTYTGTLLLSGDPCGTPPLPTPDGLTCGVPAAGASIVPTWNATDPAGDTYTVQYRLTGAVSWTTITGIVATSVTITGLGVGASYEWEVAAVIDGVTGPFSDSATCVTSGLSQPVPQSLNRWRGGVGINWHGLALVGDAFSNVIGLSDFNTFTEYGNTMQFLVTTPPLHDDRKRIFVSIFEIEVEAGQGLPTPPYGPPQMMLDVSKDGGVTWQQLQSFRSMGGVGEYFKRLRWINLGQSRTWVFRLRCTDPVRRYIIGTYIDQYKGLG